MYFPFNFWSCETSATGTSINCVSYSNSSVTVTINGADTVITMASVASDGIGSGVDSGGAGGIVDAAFAGTAVITGLVADTVYPYTVTQDGVTENGEVLTDPVGEFELFFVNCDGPGVAPNQGTDAGCYTYINHYIDTHPKVAGIFHLGDQGYIDRHNADDRDIGDGNGGTGYFMSTPIQQQKEVIAAFVRKYHYAIATTNYLGLQHRADATVNAPGRYHDLDRQSVFHKRSVYFQIDDHGCRNNQGENIWAKGKISKAIDVHKAMIGRGVTRISSDSIASVHTIGPIQFITPDRVSHACEPLVTSTLISFDSATSTITSTGPDLSVFNKPGHELRIDDSSTINTEVGDNTESGLPIITSATTTSIVISGVTLTTAAAGATIELSMPAFSVDKQEASGSALYGDTQITDILGALDASKIKIVCAGNSFFTMKNKSDSLTAVAAGWMTSNLGGQQPLGLYAPDEVSKLYLHDGSVNTAGILKQAQDNGWTVVFLHGDTHYPKVDVHNKPAALLDANDIAVSLTEISPGTVNGIQTHFLHPDIKQNTDFEGTISRWLASWVPRTNPNGNGAVDSNTTGYNTCVKMTVKADINPVELDIEILKCDGTSAEVLWSDTIIAGEQFPNGFLKNSYGLQSELE